MNSLTQINELLDNHFHEKFVSEEEHEHGWKDYDELEEAMLWNTGSPHYEKYMELRTANLHKMQPIPVCVEHRNRKSMTTTSAEALGD